MDACAECRALSARVEFALIAALVLFGAAVALVARTR